MSLLCLPFVPCWLVGVPFWAPFWAPPLLDCLLGPGLWVSPLCLRCPLCASSPLCLPGELWVSPFGLGVPFWTFPFWTFVVRPGCVTLWVHGDATVESDWCRLNFERQSRSNSFKGRGVAGRLGYGVASKGGTGRSVPISSDEATATPNTCG